MIPKSTKSVTRTTRVIIHVIAATTAAMIAPQKPAPSARRKAMNARPQAIGCRIMTRVSAFEVSVDAVLNVVRSI